MENNNKKDYTNILVHTKFYAPSISMDKDSEIVRWFSSHPLFNINGMCKIIRIDTANFSRNLAKGRISKNHTEKIEDFISYYGYEKRLAESKKENIEEKEVSAPITEKKHFLISELKEQEVHPDDIKKQIDAINAEAIPPERDTNLGRKVWALEIAKRIEALKKTSTP